MSGRPARRGYLLLEVLLSGVIAGSILGTLMLSMAHMRQQSLVASRDATSALLVQERIEALNAMDFDYLNVLRGSSPITENVTMGGQYQRVTTISARGAGGCQEFPDGSSVYINCHDINVEVTYDLKSEIRSVDADLRLYDPTP